MRGINPLLLKDGYKVGHKFQYPADTEFIYSNLTPRKSRRTTKTSGVIFFGLQFFLMEYLVMIFNEDFFDRPKAEVVSSYKRRINNYLGPDAITVDHIADLHDLGYLPLKVKAVHVGSCDPVPVGVGCPRPLNGWPDHD